MQNITSIKNIKDITILNFQIKYNFHINKNPELFAPSTPTFAITMAMNNARRGAGRSFTS